MVFCSKYYTIHPKIQHFHFPLDHEVYRGKAGHSWFLLRSRIRPQRLPLTWIVTCSMPPFSYLNSSRFYPIHSGISQMLYISSILSRPLPVRSNLFFFWTHKVLNLCFVTTFSTFCNWFSTQDTHLRSHARLKKNKQKTTTLPWPTSDQSNQNLWGCTPFLKSSPSHLHE